jgi:hypothetical protein
MRLAEVVGRLLLEFPVEKCCDVSPTVIKPRPLVALCAMRRHWSLQRDHRSRLYAPDPLTEIRSKYSCAAPTPDP